MTGLLANGRELDLEMPGITVIHWGSERTLQTHLYPRKGEVIGIGLHSTEGAPYKVLREPEGYTRRAEHLAAMFWREKRGTHLLIECDHVIQMADLSTRRGRSLHHTKSDHRTITIEVVCRYLPDGTIVVDPVTLETLTTVILELCRAFWIVPLIATDTRRARWRLRYVGPAFRGVLLHWLLTGKRGPWCPGQPAVDALLACGFLGVNVRAKEDFAVMRRVQVACGLTVDGIAGPATMRALRAIDPNPVVALAEALTRTETQ